MKITRLFLKRFIPVYLLAAVILSFSGPGSFAGEKASGTAVLDNYGTWRMFSVLKSPEITFSSGTKPIAYEKYWLNKESAAPAKDWNSPDFDDSAWLRGPVTMSCKTPFVSRSLFRGKFNVADPLRIKNIMLNITYRGGVIVYLNGEEVKRAQLPAGANPPLAEAYPAEAFLDTKGILLAEEGSFVMSGGKMIRAPKPSGENLARLKMQDRALADLELPGKLLKKGLNVLAVEIVRAPYNKIVDEKKTKSGGGPGGDEFVYDLQWNTCELREIRLATALQERIEAGGSRPQGFRVWNGSILRGDYTTDFGDPCEVLQPLLLSGAKNGIYSGKVVAGSNKPIRGLKASITELKGPAGAIPVTALRVRYGTEGNAEYGITQETFDAQGNKALKPGLCILSEIPPKETELKSGEKEGAVVPVWVTVNIPSGAAAGSYEGTLTIKADSEKPVPVQVKLEVVDWKLPDPDDYKTWIELIQSPDTLQLEYGVEPWSDKHFDLIARSMRLIRETGSGMLYIPLIAETNYGNAESMVRWIKKGENKYDFDFSVMDRYLDTAEKNLGKPKLVCFIAWEVYLLPRESIERVTSEINKKAPDRVVQPAVSLLNPVTKKVTTAFVPNYDNPAMKTIWKALFTELRARMKKRGLEKEMTMGWMCDSKPTKEEIAFWKDVNGDLPWVTHAHQAAFNKNYFSRVLNTFKTGYMSSVYDVVFAQDPEKGRLYGWKNPVIHAENIRSPELGMVPGSLIRCVGEINITGGQRGFGRLGGDYWEALKDKSGKRRGKVYERFPQSSWSNLQLRNSLLAPGPEGAVVTARFEQLREGVQECEARIFIEQALSDSQVRWKLGSELAARCEKILDERTLCIQRGVADLEVNCYGYNTPWNWCWQTGVAGHSWFQSSGWQERGRNLFALAGEVGKKLEGTKSKGTGF